MEHAEELFYQVFGAMMFCVAISVAFLMIQGYSLILEENKNLLNGNNDAQRMYSEQEMQVVNGNEIKLLFFEGLEKDVEIDGILFQKGVWYNVEGKVNAERWYHRTVIYENGAIERIVYTSQ